MNIRLFVIAIFFQFMFPLSANSLQIGFGLCCPCGTSVCPCGIIPCDASCAGAALNNLGIKTTSELNAINQALMALKSATDSVNTSVVNVGALLSQTLNTTNTELLQSISAGGSRIELSLLKEAENIKRISGDHKIQMLISALKDSSLSKELNSNSKEVGLSSQSASLSHMPDLAAGIKKLSRASDILVNEALASLDARHDTGSNDLYSTNEGYKRINELIDQMGLFSLSATNSEDEADRSKRLELLKLISMPLQSEYAPNNIESAQSNISSIKSHLLFAGLLTSESLYWEHDDSMVSSNWASPFAEEIPNSFMGVLGAEVQGRIVSDGWWQAIKTTNSAGLERELAYLSSLENIIDDQHRMLSSNISKIISGIHKSK